MAVVPVVRRRIAPAPIPGMQQNVQVPNDPTGQALAGFGANLANAAEKVSDVYIQQQEASQQQVVRDRLNKAALEASAVQDAYRTQDFPDTDVAEKERVKTAESIKQIYDNASADLNPYQAKLYTRAASDEVTARHVSVNQSWVAKDRNIQYRTLDATKQQLTNQAVDSAASGFRSQYFVAMDRVESTIRSDPRLTKAQQDIEISSVWGQVATSAIAAKFDQSMSDPAALGEANAMAQQAIATGKIVGPQLQQLNKMVYRVNDHHDTVVQADTFVGLAKLANPPGEDGQTPQGVIDQQGHLLMYTDLAVAEGAMTREKADAILSRGNAELSKERSLLQAELSKKTHESVTALKGAGTALARQMAYDNADPRIKADLLEYKERLDAQEDAALQKGPARQRERTPDYMAAYSEVANNLGLFYTTDGGVRDQEGASQLELAMERCGFREDDRATLRKARENKGQIEGLSVDDVGKWVTRLTGKKKLSKADEILYWDQVTRNFPKGTKANDVTIREVVSKLVWEGDYTVGGETKQGDLGHALAEGAANWSPRFTEAQIAETDAEMAKTKQSVLETKADITKQLAEATPEQRPSLVEQLKSIDSYLEKLNPGARVLGYETSVKWESGNSYQNRLRGFKGEFTSSPGSREDIAWLGGTPIRTGPSKQIAGIRPSNRSGTPGVIVTYMDPAEEGTKTLTEEFVPGPAIYSADKPELARDPNMWRAQFVVAKMKGLNIDPVTRQLITPDVARQRLQEKLRLTMNAGTQDAAKQAAQAEATFNEGRDYLNKAKVPGKELYGHAALLYEADNAAKTNTLPEYTRKYMKATPGSAPGKTLMDEFIAAKEGKSLEDQKMITRNAAYSVADRLAGKQ